MEAVSFRRIATVEQLQLVQLEQTHRQTDRHQLYRIPPAATPRGITNYQQCYRRRAEIMETEVNGGTVYDMTLINSCYRT